MGSIAAAPLKPLREGATDAVLDSAWFESLLADALDSEHVQAALKKALETEGAEHVVETLFVSGLVDEFVDRLATDGAVWSLIDDLLTSDGAEQLVSSGALWRLIGKALACEGAEQLVDSPALWGLIDKALAGDGADRLVERLFDSGLADRFVGRLRDSKALWRLVDEIAASQAVTSAVTQQSLSFADQFGDEIRDRSRRADDWILQSAHRHRRKGDQPAALRPDVRYVGIVSRTIAFAIDAAMIGLGAAVVELSAALIISVAHLPDRVRNAMVAVGAVLFALWSMAYLVAFWCTTGQTPGARIMRFRVVCTNGDKLKPWRAVVRCVGLVLAAIPLFAGYLPVAFARKRRGLQDYAARTIVVDSPDLSLAEQRRTAARPY